MLSLLGKPQLVNTLCKNVGQSVLFSTSCQNYFPKCTARVLAGHSHWQNVRHIKEAKDKEKQKTVNKYARVITMAIKTGGSKDPKSNSSLARVVQEAIDAKVPKATIEKLMNSDLYTEPYLIEAKGGGGIFILFESCNKHAKRERSFLKSYLKKFGCELNDSNLGGIVRDFFFHKGYILIEQNTNCEKLSDLDSATEIGIEVGAEDVESIEIDGSIFYQLQCSPNEIDSICKRLEEMDVSIHSYEDRYAPLHKVQVTQEAVDNLDELYSRIRNGFETIDRIFDNVEVVEQ